MIRTKTFQTSLLLLLSAAPLLAEESARSTHPVLRFIFAWLPFIIVLVGAYLLMRRAGVGRLGTQVDRSLEHMDKLEQQNEEILDTLRRIEGHLRR